MIRHTISIGLGILFWVPSHSTQQMSAPASYQLKPTPKTAAWGYYDAKTPPVLRIKSGNMDKAQSQTAATAAQGEKQRLIYVKHLEPPYYPPLARQTRVHGTVVMKVKIGTDGRVHGIESESMDTPKAAFAMLKDHAEKNIKTWTFGCVGCSPDAPFEHIIKFEYVLDNNLPESTSNVAMDLPDEVKMSTGPIFINPSGKTSKKGND